MESVGTELLRSLLAEAPSSYERSHLLHLLSEAQFGNEYERLHKTFALLQRTNLTNADLYTEPAVIQQQLVDRGLFDEARSFAELHDQSRILTGGAQHHVQQRSKNTGFDLERFVKSIIVRSLDGLHGLEPDEAKRQTTAGLQGAELWCPRATLEEVAARVSEVRKGYLWALEQERMALWNRSNSLFALHSCPAEVGGAFFFGLGRFYSSDACHSAQQSSTHADFVFVCLPPLTLPSLLNLISPLKLITCLASCQYQSRHIFSTWP